MKRKLLVVLLGVSLIAVGFGLIGCESSKAPEEGAVTEEAAPPAPTEQAAPEVEVPAPAVEAPAAEGVPEAEALAPEAEAPAPEVEAPTPEAAP